MKLSALRKTYPGGTEAVRGIDLDVDEGSFVVLLGPSGCGKTTTLRLIAGLEMPTGGNIILGDRDVTQLAPSERDVGFVFQFFALYPHMTVRANIGFPLDNVGIPGEIREQRVLETAEGFGISALLYRHPNQLSGGVQQRVSLARAMIRNPGIYLMDEPLGQLDASIGLDLRETIRRHKQDTRVTTVYVTHDQDEALSLADIVVVMNEGLIEQTGTPDAVYDRPESLFVANFVGSPGMNILSGEIDGPSGDTSFRSAETQIPLAPVSHRGPVLLGIRPECVSIDEKNGVRGEIIVNEYFGDHVITHIDTPFGSVAARLSTMTREGTHTCLRFDSDNIHLFHPETGRRLS
jgi:ABC-type sugar transport system ATPase subunit